MARAEVGTQETDQLPADVLLAVERSKHQVGDNHYGRLFDLARRLAGLKGYPWPDRPWMLGAALDEWNARGQAPLSGHDLRLLDKRFRLALRGVKQPKGQAFAELVRRARELPAPAAAERYQGRPKMVLLVKLCAVLESNSRGQPWPLSVRQAMDAVEASHGDAQRMLRELEMAGVIELDESESKADPGPQDDDTGLEAAAESLGIPRSAFRRGGSARGRSARVIREQRTRRQALPRNMTSAQAIAFLANMN